VIVFFGVGPVAVPVLEVDSKILDRLAGEFVANAPVYRRESRMVRDAKRGAERGRFRRVLIHRAESDGAEPGNRVRLEELRAAVNGVHRLAAGTLTGVGFGERQIRFAERCRCLGEGRLVETCSHVVGDCGLLFRACRHPL